MFKYKFVNVKVSGIFTYKPAEDYQKIIETQAREGWRFVQMINSKYTGHGRAMSIDLIFERPA